ncbi:ATP-binding cassette domain-containing protein [Streptomyces lydicus]|uniref:ATP-binding cassette domain-containing protein n=1 Tax=Streptomyces lydicus TaxID=47763 RepID=UPI0009820B0B|nr:ATP-binding cassette domain-containing protein [Streptomyces lydicus]
MYHLTGVTTCCRSGRDGDGVRVLDEVGFFVEDGGALVVRGPAGPGMSTLLRILGGLERPSRGSVVLNGTDLAVVTECRLARIRAEAIGTVAGGGGAGAAPSVPAGLSPGLTARQNVAGALVPLRLRPADRRELAGEALAEVGLGDRSEAYPGELDEGARRRVALARALVKRPAVLLADRPTDGLAGDARAGMAELFARLWSERRVSCIVATEDEALVRRAPRLVTLSQGRVTAAPRRRRQPATAAGGPDAGAVEGRDDHGEV